MTENRHYILTLFTFFHILQLTCPVRLHYSTRIRQLAQPISRHWRNGRLYVKWAFFAKFREFYQFFDVFTHFLNIFLAF